MKTLLLAAGAALTAMLAAPSAASAAPPVVPLAADPSGDIVQVQDRRDRERWRDRRGDRRDWRHRAERRGWHNGHRGFRYERPGYRFHNGWWFPPAAFGLMIQTRPAIRAGDAHVRWCHDRWRSYRAWDNSYQPNSGPRRHCVSPYS